MVHPVAQGDSYDFTHALVRHAIYDVMNPSRRVRLHRRVAEAVEKFYGDRAADHAGLLVYQYEQSNTLPGIERGAVHALTGANRANYVYAWDDTVRFLRAALAMMSADDPRRVETTAALGRALPHTPESKKAEPIASAASDLIASISGRDAAADYLADVAMDMATAAAFGGAFRLAVKGLAFAGHRRDYTWTRLKMLQLNGLDATDPDFPGIELATPERRELSDAIRHLPPPERALLAHIILFDTRADLLPFAYDPEAFAPSLRAGQFRKSARAFDVAARQLERTGRLGVAATTYAILSKLLSALGDLTHAYETYDKACALSRRLPMTSNPFGNLMDARLHRIFAMGEGWERMAPHSQLFLGAVVPRGKASARAGTAQIYAELGRTEESIELISLCIPAIERGPAASDFYPFVVTAVAEALWILGRRDHIEAIERNMLAKLIEPDFRTPMRDGRRSMAHLCALQGRYDEAREWFARARVALEEDGQRPLRALVDFDEALMHIRARHRGYRERATPLLEAALAQFRELGMAGWVARAERLLQEKQAPFMYPNGLTPREVEVLRLIAAGRNSSEISNDLSLSIRTVGRHITNIYNKIGARSRSDATACAIRHRFTKD